ncbi:unnamed protein product [Acanthoscelides obtectus]|uniref:Uncharacterized protein n=4 Tax=Acanthoscelides obtectus TaxID=200917 RepID=A0A9P0M124_ACAOB|nr:unnamed protein product [Acanthoscelides obtectus]CAK1635430.1 Leucine zipper putative tumor suppressor 2 homolog [Acanthoscelides obtectus]
MAVFYMQVFSVPEQKGKTVIRPIAFKPAMSPSSRFGVAGERYGSTPILTRPGSRLTLYGSSSDLHQHAKESRKNYSLDRKIRNSPLAMSSLTSLPHKLINYDSLESVRKSPMSNADSSINPYGGAKSSSYLLSSCSGGGGSLVDLTPSPSDSGVSELEAALRDRDSELAYLRQTMEHNEQVIFRVYQEKEKVWERELSRLKTVQESRLRASAQKVLKLEQMLMMQTYQLQQEKRRLCADIQRSNLQNERLKQEVSVLRTRMEETEWALCQKTGEISLLKTQLKECQNDQTTKCQELLQLRTEQRELRDQLEERDEEIDKLQSISSSKDEEITRLKEEVQRLSVITPPAQYNSLEPDDKKSDETRRLKAEIKELREELSEMSLNDYSDIEPGRVQRSKIIEEESLEDLEIQRLSRGLSQENIYYSNEIDKLRKELDAKSKQFECEKRTWATEKEKVLRYQKQLQMNYVQMFRRTRALEAEIETLTMELELDKNGLKKEMHLSHTIEL